MKTISVEVVVKLKIVVNDEHASYINDNEIINELDYVFHDRTGYAGVIESIIDDYTITKIKNG